MPINIQEQLFDNKDQQWKQLPFLALFLKEYKCHVAFLQTRSRLEPVADTRGAVWGNCTPKRPGAEMRLFLVLIEVKSSY